VELYLCVVDFPVLDAATIALFLRQGAEPQAPLSDVFAPHLTDERLLPHHEIRFLFVQQLSEPLAKVNPPKP
jgi:hypothetical protein